MINIIKKIKLRFLKSSDEVKYWQTLGVSIGGGTKFYNVQLDYGHPWLISVGENCILTNCRILTHDASTYSFLSRSKIGLVNIGNNVFIGVNAVILPNVTIGDDVVVGAGSIVTRDIPNNSVVAGNPAKIICTYSEYVNKCNGLINASNKFDTHYSRKTKEEIEEIKEVLRNGIGFDI